MRIFVLSVFVVLGSVAQASDKPTKAEYRAICKDLERHFETLTRIFDSNLKKPEAAEKQIRGYVGTSAGKRDNAVHRRQ